MGKYREDEARLFSEMHIDRMADNRPKLQQGKFQIVKIIKHWKRVSEEAGKSISL